MSSKLPLVCLIILHFIITTCSTLVVHGQHLVGVRFNNGMLAFSSTGNPPGPGLPGVPIVSYVGMQLGKFDVALWRQ
ncbi:hypothetical protein MTR67_040824 [Solanum verrucosum]|uniref:Uncharacterized protein n=1 Tax=Solanum verrucosum TaxID=315347 RepID=A0AAF0UKA2_SOLVR|nr:hypothetical protein MTR67_040808 [Solanum verrucosum]WMV47431.1 hypothetical protein MTR67_040816 [Solanum verrucosum]WMV47439.1 hypothetical protein MTR67_040824 [Solanum verrucosum]